MNTITWLGCGCRSLNSEICTYVYGANFMNQRVLRTFLSDEGEGPGEDIHEVGQPVGVVHRIELTNVHHIVLVLQDGRCKGTKVHPHSSESSKHITPPEIVCMCSKHPPPPHTVHTTSRTAYCSSYGLCVCVFVCV